MKSAMHPGNAASYKPLLADEALATRALQLTDSELLEHMHALSTAMAHHHSNTDQLAAKLASRLHGLAVEHDLLKICRLLHASDLAAAQFLLQHLQGRLQADVSQRDS